MVQSLPSFLLEENAKVGILYELKEMAKIQ